MLLMWSGLPFVVFKNCPISATHGNVPVGSTYQAGCGAFSQLSIAGPAKSVTGNSNEPLGTTLSVSRTLSRSQYPPIRSKPTVEAIRIPIRLPAQASVGCTNGMRTWKSVKWVLVGKSDVELVIV